MQSVSIYNLNSVNARFNQRDIECLHLQREKRHVTMISLPTQQLNGFISREQIRDEAIESFY